MIPTMMSVPRFQGNGRIEFETKPVPAPGPGQLLLRARANALCGSERTAFTRGSAITPGHEVAGVVAAVGPDTRTAVGTPGVVFLMAYCGECRSCRLGFTNQCLAKRADVGFTHDGGYGPYLVVWESAFFPIDPAIPLAEATLLLDIMGTGGHAIARGRLVHSDVASVLVMGAGPIGLGVLTMVKLMLGADVPVVIADVVPYRLELAERLGGRPLDARQPSFARAMGAVGIGAPDLAIDTAGKGETRQLALDALGKRGVLVCVGHGEGLSVDVSPQLIAPERAVLGSEYFRYDELPANLERLRRHRAVLSPIITHRYPVAEIQRAFEVFFGGNTGKVVVEQGAE